MRRSGTIEGVNGPLPPPEEEQRETAKHVVIKCRPQEEVLDTVLSMPYVCHSLLLPRS
jgi:hypothetical protein